MLSLTGWRFYCLMGSLWFDRQLVLSMPRPDPDDPLEEIDLTFIRSRGKNPFVSRALRSEDLTVSQLVSSCDHTLTAPSLTLPIPPSFYPSFPTKGLFIHCYWSKLFPLYHCVIGQRTLRAFSFLLLYAWSRWYYITSNPSVSPCLPCFSAFYAWNRSPNTRVIIFPRMEMRVPINLILVWLTE